MKISRISAAAALLLFSASRAAAGDGAALHVYGFSPDGARFVFEQWGSEDASTFPYSEISAIDTQTGADLDGAPFRGRIEKDGADPDDARQAAARNAKPVFELTRFGTTGMVSAINPEIRPSEELLPMDIYPVRAREVAEMALPASALGAAKVRIETSPAKSPHCDSIAEGRAKALTVTLTRDGAAPLILHVDKGALDARGCPTGYGIAGVYLKSRPDGDVALVVIVSSYPVGFEGPDRRFLAVAARVPAHG